MLEFRVLGPLQVLKERRAVALGGVKQRGLLALLLLERNRVVPRDRLIDALWGESPPASAANSVQVYVSKLRGLLGDEATDGEGLLLTEPPGYRLHVAPGTLDADEFERLLADAKGALGAGSFRGGRGNRGAGAGPLARAGPRRPGRPSSSRSPRSRASRASAWRR